jgi:hypothetical protein
MEPGGLHRYFGNLNFKQAMLLSAELQPNIFLDISPTTLLLAGQSTRT